MTVKDVQDEVANIKQTIASSTTCTQHTVSQLKYLLFPDISNNATPKTDAVAAKSCTARPTRGGRAPARKQPRIAILEAPPKTITPLNDQDRQNLATDTVNITLKALSDAVKSHFLAKSRSTAKTTPRAPSPRSTTSSPKNSKSPLQPLCVNRVRIGKEHHKASQHSISADEAQAVSGMCAQAECARLAFSILRLYQERKGPGKASHPLQLELAMSTLISKLIALELFDAAARELWDLKRSLMIALDVGQKAGETLAQKVVSKRRTTDLLVFPVANMKCPLLAMVVTFQLQVVRLIAAKRDASIIEASVEHLSTKASYSPANLIQAQLHSVDSSVRAQVATQLETLSQMTASMSQSLPRGEGQSNTLKSMNSLAALRLQSWSLELRCQWWKIAGYRGNAVRDLLEPFNRFVDAFRRQCTIGLVDGYHTAKDTLSSLECFIRDVESSQFSLPTWIEAWRTICCEMTEFARVCSLDDDRKEWLDKYMNQPMDDSMSPCRRCTEACKKATMFAQYDGSPHSEEVTRGVLEDAIRHIEGDLHGSSEELDSLLLVMIRLRKIAAISINKSRTPLEKSETPPSSGLVECYRNICLSSVLFLNRYLGTKSAHSNEQVVRRYHQRLEQASTVAKIFVDSVVSIARLSKADDPDKWARTEVGLRGCLRLAATIETHQTSAQNSIPSSAALSTYVSVSNVYWLRYVYFKQSSHNAKEAGKALRASIDAVEKRPLNERSAAQLQTRLEHYANAMEASREYRKAAETNMKALWMHIEIGDLDRAAAAAERQTLTAVFARESEFASLGRILVAYPRVVIRAKSDMPTDLGFFDDEHMDSASRGIALEQQLASLISQARIRSWWKQVASVVQAITTKLLALYQPHQFPIRRLRVTDTLLWLQSSYPGMLSLNDLKQCGDGVVVASDEDQGSDSGLRFTVPHLMASREAAFAIQNDRSISTKQRLEDAFETWNHQITQCTELGDLESVIGDVYVWLLHLQLLADYLDAYGLGLLRLSTLELLHKVREKTLPLDFVALVFDLTEHGLQSLRLGSISKAGVAFHRARQYLNEAEVLKKAGLFYYIGYAEYLLATGNVSNCEENLTVAREIFEDKTGYDDFPPTDSPYDKQQLVADAVSISSQLASRQGHPSMALLYARKGLRIAHQTWLSISKHQKVSSVQEPDMERKRGIERLEDSTVEATVSNNDRSVSDSAIRSKAPELWRLVPRLHRAFIQVAVLYANEGMSAVAKCYLDRSRKFAEDISATGLFGQSLVQLANIMTRSEDYAGANRSFERARELYDSPEKDLQAVVFHLNISKYQLAKGQLSAAKETCALAESTLQLLTVTAPNERNLGNESNIDLLQEQLSKFSIREGPACLPAGKNGIPIKAIRPKVPRAGKRTRTIQKPCCDASASPSLAYSSFRHDILHQQVMLALRDEKLQQVQDLLNEAATQFCTPQNAVFNAFAAAEISIRRGLGALTSDPVFGVLPDSTISLPSLMPNVPLLPPILPKTKTTKTTKGSGKGGPVADGSPKIQPSSQERDDSISHRFQEAHLGTSRIYEVAQRSCSTATLHNLSKLMAETLVMLSALRLSNSLESSKLNASMIIGIMDTPRSIAIQKGQRVINVEKAMLEEGDALCWPIEKRKMMECIPPGQMPDVASFQREYLDIIPPSWQVLTISLSRSRGEIIVSRLRSGQGPFILSMPLDRHSSRDPDEDSFGYSQAKTELQDIIALADQSTHVSQDNSQKGARAAWWERRAALDARLRDLLANMEHMWFGGFHGIFSPQVPRRDLLSRFQISLDAILNNHLPSRQGQGRKQQSRQSTLDPRVSELFVALGEPLDLSDMEEPLTDLLYFVIDILQFYGERNAYDEVDFDSASNHCICLCYHEALKGIIEPLAVQHTVLVLDKELHCFPWESLPCLINQAVTRLPSLSCLRDRILQQRRQQPRKMDDANNGEIKFCVDRRSGAYVLNPAGDLKATQETFEGSMDDLGQWEGLTGVEPSEEQMKGYLQERDIFLYFGHGSGSQYIRPRTFQRLEKCAVALLMGCSSGKLTEAGEFEPYGTPMSYMLAGCPAMLATLWNVTDKDIDRFSETVLENWGLFLRQPAPDSSPTKKTARPRGKSKVRHSPPAALSPENGNMSLDQAAAQGRGSCIFRYLNGAAPVVYGIPVFIR
ncbi:MAG: hypothetical protein Q9205_000166 [Flavoplaca limonia]